MYCILFIGFVIVGFLSIGLLVRYNTLEYNYFLFLYTIGESFLIGFTAKIIEFIVRSLIAKRTKELFFTMQCPVRLEFKMGSWIDSVQSIRMNNDEKLVYGRDIDAKNIIYGESKVEILNNKIDIVRYIMDNFTLERDEQTGQIKASNGNPIYRDLNDQV